jgi:Trk K+ transport system NAD-binding subunit
VGALFILLAADVRLRNVAGLGWAGVATVAVLMLVVRPLSIIASARGTALSWRDRAFLAWLSPRGIVAAAVASIFARRLTDAGQPVGASFEAMVFLVIAVTVVVQGLSGGWVAARLGIRRQSDRGFIIVGANALGRCVGRLLRESGEDVVMIDSNPSDAHAAQLDGLTVLAGNAHDETVLEAADIEGRRGFVAVTSNAGVNLVLAQRARRRFHVSRTFAALRTGNAAVTAERAEEAGVQIMFGSPVELATWIDAAEHGAVEVVRWQSTGAPALAVAQAVEVARAAEVPRAADAQAGERLLPITATRRGVTYPVSQHTVVQTGDDLIFLRIQRQP